MFNNVVSRMRSWRKDEPEEKNSDLPHPVTEKSQRKKRDQSIDSATIGHPIPRAMPHSITGIDDHANVWQSYNPGPTRPGPSQLAWLRLRKDTEEDRPQPILALPEPVKAAVSPYLVPMGRSASSPSMPFYRDPQETSSTYSTSSLPLADLPSQKGKLRLHTMPAFSYSTRSLRLDGHSSSSTDLFGYAADYPLVKQLSPIAEMDYLSPDSLRRTKPLPAGSDRVPSSSIARSLTNPTDSPNSEITRPSPVLSLPFITRPLNRTVSQTSSHTHLSTTSSAPHLSANSSPPSIPPLDLRPPFPGPHPNQASNGPTARPPRSLVTMPTIIGSSEGYIDDEYDVEDGQGGEEDEEDEEDGDEDEDELEKEAEEMMEGGDLESLHADSFVTASDEISASRRTVLAGKARMVETRPHNPIVQEMEGGQQQQTHRASGHSSERSRLPSASESFISRRWDRDVNLGNGGIVIFRAKRQWVSSTPAFWAFWFGFFLPVLWLIGGWHFTNFGEQPPRLTFWEFYFNAGFWKEKLCGKRNKTGDKLDLKARKRKSGNVDPQLPWWVAERQTSDTRRARLNDPKRSLRGISFGYPFIPRPVPGSTQDGNGDAPSPPSVKQRVLGVVGKPNRLFDQLYGVKVRSVRGRTESGRRMFDPWIQRCSYDSQSL